MSSIEKSINPNLEQESSSKEKISMQNNSPPLGAKTPSFSPPSPSNFQNNPDDVSTLKNMGSQKTVPEELIAATIEENSDEDKDEEDIDIQVKKPLGANQQRFEKLITQFYNANPFVYSSNKNYELEVRFGTRGVKPLTKNDYDNVIKKLKSFGFYSKDEVGLYSLRMESEYLDNITGKFKLSGIRTELEGLHNIQNYCKTNDLNEVQKQSGMFNSIKFTNKKPVFNEEKEKIFPVNFDDFNFRVSYQSEESIKTGTQRFIMDTWRKSKKSFRYINRVTFTHPDYPINVDISIVKYSNKQGYEMKRVYTTEESNVFNNPEVYEIELEIDNTKIGPATKFNKPRLILESLRKVIKFVLGGLQGTNYPISYPEQRQVLDSYMRMIWDTEYDPSKRIENRQFIGPNSITLQIKNIAANDDNSSEPNIRKNYTVTDKADGDRHLMYINETGKIYLINTNMSVIFTGAKTTTPECFHSLLDGELIAHDKAGKFINLYAAFDIYYYNKKDVRALSFMPIEKEKATEKEKEREKNNSRFTILRQLIQGLKPVSIMVSGEDNKQASTVKQIINILKTNKDLISPIRVINKEFYPLSSKQTIFSGCNEILSKVHENRFEYETDGLIFTPAYFGVGSVKIGEAGPKTKITWEHSFKWKPPKYNTIDFLITTVKGANGDEIVKPIFEDGINSAQSVQLSEYKTIQLRCGFSERRDGYINPCQDVIDDKLPDYKPAFEDKYTNDLIPKQFYPTCPYDPEAGICNIMLRNDDSGVKQMFSEEDEVFTDGTIVEFSYNLDGENGWRWIPLRVRHDKTAEYRQGQKQYGNAFKVADSNWKSIHNPVDENMIRSGLNIPDVTVDEDTYYNKPSGIIMTEPMKNFHNLYVKKMLVKCVSKQGDTLIDFACGKAGDLPKWISARLSFVFGIDISKDNLENRLDGACARFLNLRKTTKNMPYALFVNGNSAYNIKNGSAMLNDKAKQITSAVFGIGTKEPEKIGKAVARQHGIGEDGFNISSCQFAIHYFLENPDTLQGFIRNISECSKIGGYFIGTAYDGKTIFNLLRKQKTGESIKIIEDGKKIWEIVKGYGSDIFEDNSSSIGYRIDVFQESINQLIPEYLVNFDYLDRVLETYGFKLIDRNEAQSLGLPEGSGLFSGLFMNMLEEIKRNKYKEADYGKAAKMSAFEKKISFLNRYFVYKKIRHVNTEKVELELGEYSEANMAKNEKDTDETVKVAKEINKQLTPKIRKLSKKILLIAASEAVDEPESTPALAPALEKALEPALETEKETKQKITNVKQKGEKAKQAKKLIIEEEDEE